MAAEKTIASSRLAEADFTRQRDVAMGRVDVAQAVKDVLALFRRHLYLSNILIEERYAADLPLIDGDIHRCKQLFFDLIINALVAMPYGGMLTVETSLAMHDRWKGIEVRFAGTGGGIPEEHLGRIFDPFFTTMPVGKGTGLGLSKAYSIAQQHGGSIQVESEVGQGFTFTVTLPVEQADARNPRRDGEEGIGWALIINEAENAPRSSR